MPVLNLAGRQSGIFPPAGTAEVAKRVQDGCTVFFEAANHWLYMEQPNEQPQSKLSVQDGRICSIKQTPTTPCESIEVFTA